MLLSQIVYWLSVVLLPQPLASRTATLASASVSRRSKIHILHMHFSTLILTQAIQYGLPLRLARLDPPHEDSDELVTESAREKGVASKNKAVG